jgi:hypothetical protein
MPKTRANACIGKIQHATRKGAEDHLHRLIRGGASAKVLAVYRCRWDPSHWHVGHRMARKR